MMYKTMGLRKYIGKKCFWLQQSCDFPFFTETSVWYRQDCTDYRGR